MRTKPSILLVESNPAEEERVRKAIASSEIDCTIVVARDGAEACHVLFDGHDPAPTFILLELGIPQPDGFEVLKRIRGCEATKRIPVIIFTKGGEQPTVDKSFELHANSFVEKDHDAAAYETRLKLLLYYWIAVNSYVNP